MKAITLTQPWATLVAIGAKRIETRSWSTRYRGPLAIHASKKLPSEWDHIIWGTPIETALHDAGYLRIPVVDDGQARKVMPRGAVIAIADLWCVDEIGNGIERLDVEEPERSFGDYTDGRYAWSLRDVRVLKEPIPAKGALGLWEWTPPEELQFK